MRQPIAFAVFVGAVLAATGAWAACPSQPVQTKDHHAKLHKPNNDCVDFNTLPQISEHIVAAEPAPAAVKAAAPADPGDPAYNGPTLGLSKPEPGVRPAPTVGYKWSLD